MADRSSQAIWLAFFATAVALSRATAATPVAAAPDSSPAQSRLGMNLSGVVDWNTEHPFVDVFRVSRAWISQKQGEPWGKGPPLELTERGWVKRLPTNCFAETLVLTAGHAPSGEYLCLYDGEGQIEFGGQGKVVSREPGRIRVNIDGQKEASFVSIRQTNPENPVRNIRLLMPGLEAELQDRLVLAGLPQPLARIQHTSIHGLDGHQRVQAARLGRSPQAG